MYVLLSLSDADELPVPADALALSPCADADVKSAIVPEVDAVAFFVCDELVELVPVSDLFFAPIEASPATNAVLPSSLLIWSFAAFSAAGANTQMRKTVSRVRTTKAGTIVASCRPVERCSARPARCTIARNRTGSSHTCGSSADERSTPFPCTARSTAGWKPPPR